MLVKVLEPREIELKPGDRVEFDYTSKKRKNGYYIRRIVNKESIRGSICYAVFNNSTWRPITSYGKTWWKVGEVNECSK